MTPTLRTTLIEATKTLQDAGIDGAAGDARILLAHCAGIERGRLTLHMDDAITSEVEFFFPHMIADRVARKPVSRILQGRWFYDRWFEISEHVLDPRPETEILIQCALEHPFSQVLDLGTGSGAIITTLLAEQEQAIGIASDISAEALRVAQANADRIGVLSRMELIQSDWFAHLAGPFDLIVSNPPYIAPAEMAQLAPEVRLHDPEIALTDRVDGLNAYRAIAAQALEYLTPGGRLLVEIGPTQAQVVTALFDGAGLVNISTHNDLDGRDRVISAYSPETT